MMVVLAVVALPIHAQDVQPASCIGEAGKVQWLVFENIEGYQLKPLFHLPNFPQGPDRLELLESISSPRNYHDNYAGLIRGFIRAPRTGEYVFNVTGDDRSEFWLSTDQSPSNLVMIAEVPGWSSPLDYYKYPQQTSQSIHLEAGEYYYFQAIQKERGGGDFVQVQWQIPADEEEEPTGWSIIGGNYIYADTCQPVCPPAGTPCDDGNSKTTFDQQDGNCNCVGISDDVQALECVGAQGQMQSLIYNAPTGSLDDVHDCEDYPMHPIRSEFISDFSGPVSNGDHYFSRTRGYLYIPVSGTYEFAITGNEQLSLMMSDDHTEDEVKTIAYLERNTEEYNFDTYDSQLSGPLYLEGGRFHYIELLHRETWGGDYYNVFWKTPFTDASTWKTINGTYLFAYNCETACIPAGTACDDGDPLTFDDRYDDNCACAGTPCQDADCSNAMAYQPYEGCTTLSTGSTEVSKALEDSWQSCEIRMNPNPARGQSHWIMYDFGKVIKLEEVRFWNLFVESANMRKKEGYARAHFDYSIDMTNWNSVYSELPRTHTLAENEDYPGLLIEELRGKVARYLVITEATASRKGKCQGFSKITFEVSDCPDEDCGQGNTAPLVNLTDNPYGKDDSFDGRASLDLSPNPTNAWTSINFNIAGDSQVSLGVFSKTGQLISWVVQDAPFSAGPHEKLFPVQQLPAGVYFVNLITDAQTLVQRLVVID